MKEHITRLLLKKAYEKAEMELMEESGAAPTPHAQDQWLSDHLMGKYSAQYSYKSFENRRLELESGEAVAIRQKKVRDALSKLLGYDDFDTFYEAYRKDAKPNDKEDKKRRRRKIKIVITISFLVVLGVFAAVKYDLFQYLWDNNARGKCMVWVEDHYEESPCDMELLEDGKLKLYKEDRILHFKKKHPDSITAFFDAKRNPLIWYGKNSKGEHEYFTDLGLHPETGKTLKPITQYIINKYILSKVLEQQDSIP